MQPFMKTMIVLAAIACLAMLGIALAGCTQEHFDTADQVAEVATDIAQGTEAVLDSPAGGMIPQPANGIIRLAGEAVLGLLLGTLYRFGVLPALPGTRVTGKLHEELPRCLGSFSNMASQLSTSPRFS